MIYFTSDWHIGHDKPFIYEPIGFSSIQEHDTEILKRCNSLVDYNDELWILGDLALGQDEEEWNRIYHSLNCQKIHIIQGNHDTENRMDKYVFDYNFIEEGAAAFFNKCNKIKFYLSHYPTLVDNFDDNKKYHIWNLSGHTHSKNIFYDPYTIYNVSLDAHNCYPVSLEQIIKDIKEHER